VVVCQHTCSFEGQLVESSREYNNINNNLALEDAMKVILAPFCSSCYILSLYMKFPKRCTTDYGLDTRVRLGSKTKFEIRCCTMKVRLMCHHQDMYKVRTCIHAVGLHINYIRLQQQTGRITLRNNCSYYIYSYRCFVLCENTCR